MKTMEISNGVRKAVIDPEEQPLKKIWSSTAAKQRIILILPFRTESVQIF